MSAAIDVNVLLYASDRASPFHPQAVQFLAARVADRDVLCLAWPTVVSYLRMATHPALFASPLSPEDAMSNIASLVSLPHVRLLAEEEGFWDIYRGTVRDAPARGNQVPDAHLAALLRQHGVTLLYTKDRDFRRFEFLQVHDPFA